MIRMDEGIYGQATIVAILTQEALPPAGQSGHDVQSVVQRYEEGLDQLEHRGADRNLERFPVRLNRVDFGGFPSGCE